MSEMEEAALAHGGYRGEDGTVCTADGVPVVDWSTGPVLGGPDNDPPAPAGATLHTHLRMMSQLGFGLTLLPTLRTTATELHRIWGVRTIQAFLVTWMCSYATPRESRIKRWYFDAAFTVKHDEELKAVILELRDVSKVCLTSTTLEQEV